MLLYSADTNFYDIEVEDLANQLKKVINKDSVFVCIGTDKVIFDALGPLTGTKLKEKAPHLNVYGTLQYPLTALNINQEYKLIKNKHKDSIILAIDTCLTQDDKYLYTVNLYDEPAKPGGGMNKKLTPVGTHRIVGVIDTENNSDIFRKNVRLFHVNEMADFITDSILKALEV